MQSKLEALRSVAMFQGIPEPLCEEILATCVEKTFLKGETVFLEGETPKGLWVVWRGHVKIYKMGEGGREQILEIEGPGRSIAELPLFDGLPYPASCAAMEDSILLTIAPETFHRLVEREPMLARSVIASLSQRMRRMVALIEEISLKAVSERLADLVLEMSEGRDTFEVAWSHQEIAARIGTVREIVSRTIGRMNHEGVLRVEGRTFTILDRRRLTSLRPSAPKR